MDDQEYEYDDRPSRSSVKRDKQKIQDTMLNLLSLPKPKRATLVASELFLSELEVAAAMKPSTARNRMIRRLANLAEAEPSDLLAAQSLLEVTERAKAASNLLHHGAEQWRTKLITEDRSAMTEFCDAHPIAETQKLRQLQREYLKANNEQRKKRLFRELYQEVFAILSQAEEQPED